ncbi:tetratricopeptide repeat protein [Tahibacter aquaticus]|uniref:tetratricopeptide repeat protein n=1 Tax=Tahibacter aquaticus TaxID=520092 RepID=UPI001FB573EF|nr:tetratricopeptide repeat protein [Tahibacter aquaticus]
MSERQHHAQAERVHLEALEHMQQILGHGAYQIAFVLRARADTYRTAGQPAKAVPIMQRTVQLAQATDDSPHPMALPYRLNLAYAQTAAACASRHWLSWTACWPGSHRRTRTGAICMRSGPSCATTQ